MAAALRAAQHSAVAGTRPWEPGAARIRRGTDEHLCRFFGIARWFVHENYDYDILVVVAPNDAPYFLALRDCDPMFMLPPAPLDEKTLAVLTAARLLDAPPTEWAAEAWRLAQAAR